MELCGFKDFEFGLQPTNKVCIKDPTLKRFEEEIQFRSAIESAEGLDAFTSSYKRYGVNVLPNGGILCQEWAPNARAVYIRGEFDDWKEWPYEAKAYGKWELYIPPHIDGSSRIPHLSDLQIVLEPKGSDERVVVTSPWATYLLRDDDNVKWKFWHPPRGQPTNRRPVKPTRLRIYEAHVGIASNDNNISTYNHFTTQVLPRIRNLGYNCILLMAIAEHSRYSDMGQRVSNFFAASSRYGNPEELRELVNVAHGMGITVLIDVMHHEAANESECGLKYFDGSNGGYFRPRADDFSEEERTCLFDYSKWEVIRFLASNLRFFMDEFNIDGFRFCAVTSMVHQDRAENHQPTGDIGRYFGDHVNTESIIYLMFANDMLHSYYPNIITISEDASEMPGMCQPVHEGGLGFDFRLGKALPNKWAKLMTENGFDEWNMGYIFHLMTQQSIGDEATVVFAENHQQSKQGETLISALLQNELQTNMSDELPLTPVGSRALSLHKMIRLIYHSLAGRGYLNFIGNEFGHPGGLHLPDHSNGSYEDARRRFELCDDDKLRFKYLQRFDTAMNQMEQTHGWLSSPPGNVSRNHEADKVVVFERSDMLFLFNFHPFNNYQAYLIGVHNPGTYKIILDTDAKWFGGNGRTQESAEFRTDPLACDKRNNSLLLPLPSTCAFVLKNTV